MVVVKTLSNDLNWPDCEVGHEFDHGQNLAFVLVVEDSLSNQYGKREELISQKINLFN